MCLMHVVMRIRCLGSHSGDIVSSDEKLILLVRQFSTCTSWFNRVRSRFLHDLLTVNTSSCFHCVSSVNASFTKEVIDWHLVVAVLRMTTSYGPMLLCCTRIVCVLAIVGTCCCLSGCVALVYVRMAPTVVICHWIDAVYLRE